jgi:Ankyrin repeats (3 copies)
MKNNDSSSTLFYKAVAAIDTGDIELLKELLHTNPQLVTKPLDTPNSKGYFKNPYLLWFIADNPIRHEKLPANIAAITKIIIEALQKSNHKNYQHIIDYTLGLVCTGRIPKECGVQIDLMELLINEGAKVKGSVLGPIGQRNFEAAEFLINKGASYNLGTAVGLNKLDDMKKIIKTATPKKLYVALVVASFFGNADVISLLLAAGANANGKADSKDFGGFHSHATALHQAVFSGSLQCVKLLTAAGAKLNVTDKGHNGTPAEWAEYMQTESKDEAAKNNFKEIASYLSGIQNDGKNNY